MSRESQMELPPGWAAAPLSHLIEPRREKASPSDYPDAAFIGMDHVESHTTRLLGTAAASLMKSTAVRFRKGDVLYGRLRPYLNKVALPDFDGLASGEFIVLPETECVLGSFLKHRLSAADFVSFANHLNEGDRPRVNFGQIGRFVILIPPPREQRRIVSKIEELFSELDGAIKSLEYAHAQLTVYRQAVLKHAFEGKFTAQCRKKKYTQETPEQLLTRILNNRTGRYTEQIEDWKVSITEWMQDSNGKKPPRPRPLSVPDPLTEIQLEHLPEIPSSWRWTKLGELFAVYVGATPNRKNRRYWNGEINWISSGEVGFNRIDSTAETITQEGLANTSTEVHPIGTVMLGMIGEGKTRGRAAITNIEACHNQNTAAIRVSEAVIPPKYVYYYLLYRYEDTRRIGSGNNQRALNKERVSNLPIPLPTLDEQYVLVEALDEHLSTIEQIDREIDSALARTYSLREAIVKRAFSGQLVPQDPNDESALVLLDRIKAGREQMTNGAVPRKTGKRTKTKVAT